MKKDIIYTLSCLAFIIVIGGAVYEHMSVVPAWSAAPPASLSMFQGKYGLHPELFWMIIHPVNLLLFAVVLLLYWKSPRRKNILTVFAGYVLILVITFVYFVPELVSITKTPYTESVVEGLVRRASKWEVLALVRLMVLIFLSIILMLGLTKGNERRQNTTATS